MFRWVAGGRPKVEIPPFSLISSFIFNPSQTQFVMEYFMIIRNLFLWFVWPNDGVRDEFNLQV